MFSRGLDIYIISLLVGGFTFAALNLLQKLLGFRRARIIDRLKGINLPKVQEEEDILQKPFLDRTLGNLVRWLIRNINNITSENTLRVINEKLEKAGNPKSLTAGNFLVIIILLFIIVLLWSLFLMPAKGTPLFRSLILALTLATLAGYLPWFALAKAATGRQNEIRRSLPDVMDLLVVSVEAGLGFDMALLKVVERFRGPVAEEFQKALREMQLGKPRKDALRDMAVKVDVMELSSLVNAVIQSEQLGAGVGAVLRMQADLIREKRQQWIEEQAMKTPIKMLFPLVFFIFPSIFIIILGPALLNIMKLLGD